MKSTRSLILTTFLNLLITTIVCGQTYKGESIAGASYGFISGTQISDGLSFSAGFHDYAIENSQTGSAFITYRYFISSQNAIGFTIGKQTIWGMYFRTDVTDNPVDSFTLNNTTIAAEFLHVYKNAANIQWYTIIGVGYSIYNRQDKIIDVSQRGAYYLEPANGAHFNFQYTPIAVMLGPKFSIFSIFMELGIGYKGIFNFGLNCKFGKKKKPEEKK